MQALIGGAVDYAGTSLDVAIQAYANGADIRRLATTGRLPLLPLVTAPKSANDIAIDRLECAARSSTPR